MKPIIRVENLSKQYTIGAKTEPYATLRESLVRAARKPIDMVRRNGKSEDSQFWALKDVSFDVMPGEVVGIIGRNGAGKSTLLKILSRITEPTTGRVELYGRVGSLLEVGTGFHPELTGRENIFLNGAILGMRREEISKKFDEIVDFAEIEDFLDTPVKRYSSGMYVRLAFAVAAHLEPEILMVDEVLAVGDAQFQKKCLNKMQDVSEHGRTVIFVSHSMPAIRNLCSRSLVLDKGKIRSDGETDCAVTQYLEKQRPRLERWDVDLEKSNDIYFRQIETEIIGSQPKLNLKILTRLRVNSRFPTAFLAFYVGSVDSIPLMETLPKHGPFIEFDGIKNEISIVSEIELPPLVPGAYTVGAWIGSNYTHTLDWVSEALTFEITESPMENRTVEFPKHAGFISAKSELKAITYSTV